MHGLIIVDKPVGKTSFDIVREVRKKVNIKKVGHIGTLDPLASGVLIILVGEATKLSDYLMEHDKEYIAKLYLGEKRDTGDSEGKVIQTEKVNDFTEKQIIDTLNTFLGDSEQIPPMYSAIKVDGKKLYDLARQGKIIDRKPRRINISEIELLEYKSQEITFRVVCSKGTYIRVLCENIAEKLNTCGYMKELKRTRIGNFKLEDKEKFVDLKDILEITSPKDKQINVELNNNEVEKIINGVKLKLNFEDGLVNIYNNNKFVGIGEIENNFIKRKIII